MSTIVAMLAMSLVRAGSRSLFGKSNFSQKVHSIRKEGTSCLLVPRFLSIKQIAKQKENGTYLKIKTHVKKVHN